jgi:hypothetical protein
MSSRLAAGMAVLCTVLASQAIAAERRPVAVIDLSNTDPGRAKAIELGQVLNNHAELKPIDDTSLSYELYADLRDADADRIAESRQKQQAAEGEFENRDFAAAANTALAGQARLQLLAPTPEVVKLYAELTFVLAEARLGERKPAEATALFVLVHQLNPELRPNAARTLPEVIDAFEAAKKAPPTIAKVSVGGSGTAIIDGKEVGTAPAWFDVSAGIHVVWLVGPDRDPRAQVVTVPAGQKVETTVMDAPTSQASKVRRARLALKLAPDPFARVTAMRNLAKLLGVSDAVLLTSSNQRLIIQTWRDNTLGFSPLREIKATDRPAELLEPLAPKPVIKPKIKDPDPHPIPVVQKKWWQKKRYWVIALGVVSVAVGSAVAYDRWDRFVPFDGNSTFDNGGTLGRR